LTFESLRSICRTFCCQLTQTSDGETDRKTYYLNLAVEDQSSLQKHEEIFAFLSDGVLERSDARGIELNLAVILLTDLGRLRAGRINRHALRSQLLLTYSIADGILFLARQRGFRRIVEAEYRLSEICRVFLESLKTPVGRTEAFRAFPCLGYPMEEGLP
jgi:hypothetical protein